MKFSLTLLAVGLIAGGYVANIVKLFGHGIFDIELLCRLLGLVFVPLGVVLGYV